MVWQAAQRVKIPIVGMGGVSKWEDAVELMLAGASALQIGTALFTDPYAPVKILDGLNRYLDQNKIASVTELTGKVQVW
jgi:dihydroorotate dehydrogenase (NAD+) catalytic subunit